MKVALVSIETDEVWALVDLRPDSDVVIASTNSCSGASTM